MITEPDTPSQFWLSALTGSDDASAKDRTLQTMCQSWPEYSDRTSDDDSAWVDHLTDYLNNLVDLRLNHVRAWVESNTSRFTGTHAAVDNLHRTFEAETVEVKGNVQLCKVQCASCRLLCLHAKFHDGAHQCATDHKCHHSCQFIDEHSGYLEPCSLP